MDESLFDSSLNISAPPSLHLQSDLETICNEACTEIIKRTSGGQARPAGPREGFRCRVAMLHDCVMDSPETVFVSRVVPSLASQGVHFGRMVSAVVLDPRGFVWGFEFEEVERPDAEPAEAFVGKGAGGVWVSLLGPSKNVLPHKFPAVFDARTAVEKHNKKHTPVRTRAEWQELWETNEEEARKVLRSMAVAKDVCDALRNVLQQQ
jgi:hypothetical protein